MDYQGGVEVEETEGDLDAEADPHRPEKGAPPQHTAQKVADDGHRDLDAGTAQADGEATLS